jgi:uncharacterized protein YjbI with pentapeptide repeats
MAFKKVTTIFGTFVVGLVFYLVSFGNIDGVPSYAEDTNLAVYDLRLIVPRTLEIVGLTPFANLVGEDVSTKPPNWTAKSEQYPLVKGARLVGARMEYAQARSAFFASANLFRARLAGANISNADFSNAILMAADLSRAALIDTNLSNAQLQGADLSNAKLLGADFSKATLTNANLSNANLEGAKLSNTMLALADLSHADLAHADLSAADLSNANLSDADLSGARLLDADLSHVNGLTRNQIATVITNEGRRLPQNLPP